MDVVDKIQEKLDRELYTVSVLGSREAVFEEMWDDIESLLILFRASRNCVLTRNECLNRAIEVEIDRLKDYANSSDDYDRAGFAINILKNLL